MAKPTVTEADLQAGLGNLSGSFGTLVGQGGPKRDSPFGREHVRQAMPVATPPQQPQPIRTIELTTPVAKEAPPVQRAQGNISVATTGDAPAPVKEETVPKVANATLATEHGEPREVLREPAKPKKTPSLPVVSKVRDSSEEAVERITVPITAESRDKLTLIASTLQRRKLDKSERITSNTLIRVAVRLLINDLTPGEGDAPNNEEELYELLKARTRKK